MNFAKALFFNLYRPLIGYIQKQHIKNVKAWLKAVEAHYGVRPIIYTHVQFYNHYLRGHFEDYPLWIAHYLQPRAPRIGRSWHFWQHSERGKVNGISSRVDFNVFRGDTLTFKSLLIPARL